MSQIILTHSFIPGADPKQRKLGQPFPPLGTLYAAAILRKAEAEFSFADATFFRNADDILPMINKERPRFLVIYDDGFNFVSKMCLNVMRKTIVRMTEICKETDIRVIVCSSDAMDHYRFYIENGVSYVILGEGERTLEELVTKLLKSIEDPDVSEVDGIAWRKNGDIIINKKRALIEDPDEIPFPAWDLIDPARYRSIWKKNNGYFMLNMVTTRGCPYQCIWCAKPVYGNHYSSRSPENVVNELAFLKATFDPDQIWFADDIFGLKPGWTAEFSSILKSRNLKIPFTIQSRADLLLDDQQIRPLQDAGCRKVWLGVESGSQHILDAMRKGITTGQIKKASEMLKESGIEQAFFLQLGFPGETFKDILETKKLLHQLMPEDIGISVTYPLPGTKFYEEVHEELRSKQNWNHSDDLAPLVMSSFPRNYYKPLHRYMHRDFRLHQAMHFLFREPEKLDRHRIRSIVLSPYYLITSWFYRSLMFLNSHAKSI